MYAPAEDAPKPESSNPPIPELPPVVVEGKSLAPPESALAPPTAFEHEKAEVQHTPGGADVVSVEAFEKGKTGTLQDLFKGLPGVFIESNNGAQDVKISIRGSGIQSDNVIGITFLLDGMPLNQGDGEAVLEDFDLLGIQGATIYRGANALQYGALSLGGAVNFLSKTGYEADKLDTRFEAGSFGYFVEGASTGAVKGRIDYFLDFADIHSDGFREHSVENSQKLSANTGYKVNSEVENRIYLLAGRLDREVPGDLTKAELKSDPRQPGDDAVAQDFHQKSLTLRLADKLTFEDCDQTLSAGVSWQPRQFVDRDFFAPDFLQGITRFNSDDFDAVFNYENRRNVAGRQNRLTLGLNTSFEAEHDRNFENDGGAQGPLTNADRTLAFNASLYGEEQFYTTEKLSVLAGYQLSFAGRKYDDIFGPSGVPDQSHRQSFFGAAEKAGVIYDFHKDGQLFANVSGSFQPPSFDDLAAVQEDSPDGAIYRPLRAQTAQTVEAGSRGTLGRFTWEGSLYRAWVRNELLMLKDAQGNSIGTINATPTRHQGVETALEVQLFRGLFAGAAQADPPPVEDGDPAGGESKQDALTLHQAYTLCDFHFEDDPNFGSNRIAGIPVHFYHASLEYEHPSGFYAEPELDWNITRYPVDHANTLFADPYALLGAKVGVRIHKHWDAFVEGRNLINRRYAATVDPQSDARLGGPPDAFRPGNGRAIYGGFSFKW